MNYKKDHVTSGQSPFDKTIPQNLKKFPPSNISSQDGKRIQTKTQKKLRTYLKFQEKPCDNHTANNLKKFLNHSEHIPEEKKKEFSKIIDAVKLEPVDPLQASKHPIFKIKNMIINLHRHYAIESSGKVNRYNFNNQLDNLEIWVKNLPSNKINDVDKEVIIEQLDSLKPQQISSKTITKEMIKQLEAVLNIAKRYGENQSYYSSAESNATDSASESSYTSSTFSEKSSSTKSSYSSGSESTNTSTEELPPGWEEFFDENYGIPYYYNERENKTVWEIPTNTQSQNTQSNKNTGSASFKSKSANTSSERTPGEKKTNRNQKDPFMSDSNSPNKKSSYQANQDKKDPKDTRSRRAHTNEPNSSEQGTKSERTSAPVSDSKIKESTASRHELLDNAFPEFSHISESQLKKTNGSYYVLGLKEGSSRREINIAFRDLSLKLHPDKQDNFLKNPENAKKIRSIQAEHNIDNVKELLEEKFKIINSAKMDLLGK